MNIIPYFLITIAAMAVVFVICRVLPQEKIKKINAETEKKQHELELAVKELEQEYNISKKQKESALAILDVKKEDTEHLIEMLAIEAEKAKNHLIKHTTELASNEISKEVDAMQQAYESNEARAKDQYAEIIKDLQEQLRKVLAEKDEQSNALLDIRNKVDNATESWKKSLEEKEAKDFYRIVISDLDKEEIQKIRSIEPYLRDKEPLNKVIWKAYYEKPLTSMLGRVVGPNVKTGIYKITNLNNNMCYVGQAVDIANRWKQHVKRGIGAETPTRNKLYPAMLADGVENFMFEILEVCDKDKLDGQEDYWQEFYHAKDFGYSIK